jgi:hypothetical protein
MTLFCQAIYDAPELVDRLVEVCGAFSQYIAEVFAENPSAPLMFMGEDVAGSSGPIFSPQFIRQKALPIWKKIAKPIKDKGFKFLYHTDGKAEKILPIVVDEFGADGFNPIERNGCNDIFAIREKYPRTLLFGNVCCEVTLPFGSLQRNAGTGGEDRAAGRNPHRVFQRGSRFDSRRECSAHVPDGPQIWALPHRSGTLLIRIPAFVGGMQ